VSQAQQAATFRWKALGWGLTAWIRRFLLGRRDARAPLLRWEATARGGDDDPWGHIEDFGWSWDTRFSEDENLLNLAFAVSHNTYRFNRGMKCGLYGAVLCRHKDEKGSPRIEILALGMHFPVNLASEESRVDEMLAVRPRSQKEIMGCKSKSLHAEVMLVARCAREGIATDGCWLYCLQAPCWNCVKALMMAGITRIVFQELDEHPSFERQREVVHATGADWHCLVPSRKRLAYLKAFQEHWAKNHLPRLRKIKLQPALDGSQKIDARRALLFGAQNFCGYCWTK